MKISLIAILLCIFYTVFAYGQNTKYQFAEQVFKDKYRKHAYDKFRGHIERINAHTFQYGDKLLTINTEDEKLVPIFSHGIFHPDIIDGRPATKPLTKTQLDTMSSNARLFNRLLSNDKITISAVEQLEKLNPDSKTKRFKFWLYSEAMMNPTECYFELYNSTAVRESSFEEFIKNSVVTFYYRGSIII